MACSSTETIVIMQKVSVYECVESRSGHCTVVKIVSSECVLLHSRQDHDFISRSVQLNMV